MQVVAVTTPEQLEVALAIRFEVFVDEQGVDPTAERDVLDPDPRTHHCLVVDDEGIPLATGRLLAPHSDVFHGEAGFGAMDPSVPHIGRVAVRKVARNTGAGSTLMQQLEAKALERFGADGSVRVELSAQDQAMPFYEKLGYTVFGEAYLDEGISHHDAFKVVTGP
ncbi:GNAT family N-acetyltransferase [Demequina sp. TTPB684]|uniref:GNAT family N-acetyltransferase n=1 Tax=unclassified Demequina TaxID=2620311 RepID=UPI001CF495E3|nr:MULTISPECIES: GNAT family N-acetyltransferase [unclassified Demequina]MCB2412128.1 GNAT family N-acetyltransferase [Demequina sp. TTPB684]UPU89554.1 GNAT family N-acetyltransferase [Demequina sp. TMPB413]